MTKTLAIPGSAIALGLGTAGLAIAAAGAIVYIPARKGVKVYRQRKWDRQARERQEAWQRDHPDEPTPQLAPRRNYYSDFYPDEYANDEEEEDVDVQQEQVEISLPPCEDIVIQDEGMIPEEFPVDIPAEIPIEIPEVN